jgi:hypothetical protein
MATYQIICNEGSLEGGGRGQREMKIEIIASSLDEARTKFKENMENKIYGRKILEIKELTVNDRIEKDIRHYVYPR